MSDHLAIVAKAIQNIPEHSGAVVRMDSRFKEDLQLDSMDIVDLLVALEDELHVNMDDKSVENIQTVRELVNYLDKVTAGV